MEEIRCLIQTQQVARINFSDDSFTLDRNRVLELCRMLRENFGPMSLEWQCATRVDLVDNEILREMHLAGCCTIQYGVEAGSQEILDSIGKKIRLAQVKEAVGMTVDYFIKVICSFMFPHPDDTEQTIRAQIQLMKELLSMGSYVTLALTTPFPGTYYYEHTNELGIKILANNWDEYDCKHLIITTKNLSEDKLNHLWQEMVNEVGMMQPKGTT
jgi:radical SAM superfamily enzyme YgiQ (UPF0313 family)